MLILSNGNYKTGSTWVTQILHEIIETQEIESKYCDRKYKNRIRLDRIEKFFREQYCVDKHYVSKTHFFLPHEILAIKEMAKKYPIIVIGSSRNIGDALISHFHHLTRDRKISHDLLAYSKRIGFYKRIQMEKYNQRWQQSEESEIILSFEALKDDFDGTLEQLRVHLTKHGVCTKKIVKSQVAIDTLRKRAEKAQLDEKIEFFRSGKTGEFEQIIRNSNGEKIKNNIYREVKFLDKVIYWLLMEKRIQLKRWLNGQANSFLYNISEIL